MKTGSLLLLAACPIWGGCLSISTGRGSGSERVVSLPSQPPVITYQQAPSSWPPPYVVLDPNASYVTGLSDDSGPEGRAKALEHAGTLARGMGFPSHTLSEVCQDLSYRNSRGAQGTRILYRINPSP